MKRLVTAAALFALVAAIPATASAQQFGVKAGVNSATLTDAEDEFADISRRLGLVAGIFVRTPERGRFSFQVEGLFTEKGLKIEDAEDGIDIDADLRLRYLEVPLLGRADFGTPGSSSGLYAVAGVAPAFKLSAEVSADAMGESESTDISDDIESFDLGLVGGVGFQFGRGSIEARYTHGLSNINKEGGDEDSVKNRVFSVTFGYRFR